MNYYKNFLKKLIEILKYHALNVKKLSEKHKNKKDRNYYDGLLLGYYEILSGMKNRLWSFGIPLKEVKFDIDPDRDLLGSTWKGYYKRFGTHDESAYKYFLPYFIEFVKEDALEAKNDLKTSKKSDEKLFHKGRLFAYYEALDTIKKQLIAFQIPLKEVKFDIDPDRDLLGKGKRRNK